MDHRITVAIIAVFSATLGFTFLVASITSSVGPDGVQLALGAEGENGSDAPPEPAGPTPREQLIRLLEQLDRRTDQWRRDHAGRQPDFVTYPAWEQLVLKTDPDGKPKLNGAHAPYLSQAPVNPLNHLTGVVATDKPLRVADRVPETDARVGFVYSTPDGCYWGTNGSGRVVITRAAAKATTRPAPSPTTAPSAH